MRIYLLLIFALLLVACDSSSNEGDIEKWKKEILQVEADFAQMAEEEGIPEAFLFYADEDAVLLRNNKLVKGKKAIAESYRDRQSKDKISLAWKPDFVEVSAAGDLGYTYGEYQYKITDSIGVENTSTGIFHTVWKRQEDGSWKYVWD